MHRDVRDAGQNQTSGDDALVTVLRNAATCRAPARGARAASDELVGELLTFPFAKFSKQSFQNLEPRAKNVENALYILIL